MNNQRRILLVDDDPGILESLALDLEERLPCRVQRAGSARDALARLRVTRFDAMVLDVGLPDGDGRDLCALLRARGVATPIVMLSGAALEADVVRGLEAGANDYLAKPCRPGELVARLRAQMRMFEQSEAAEIVVGPFVFRPGARTLQPSRPHAGAPRRPIRLTDKETALLRFLHKAEGDVVSRETLLRHVWGYGAGTASHTVETHVYRLRRKLERDTDASRLLVSESGGYRLAVHEAPHLVWPDARRTLAAQVAMAC